MSFLDRFRRRGPAQQSASRVDSETIAHLEQFIATRRGVEGFVEPPTVVSGITLLLVARDGEWTRRRVPSAAWAHRFCNDQQTPSYDAAVVGVPQRMREYNSRVSAEKKARVLDERRDRDAGPA
jgi:hypothetical protein